MLFSTAIIAKLVMPDIYPLTWFILALRVVSVATFVISSISSSIFLILALYASFLTTSVFTTFLSLFKSAGGVCNFPMSNLSISLFRCLNQLTHFLFYQLLIYQRQLLNYNISHKLLRQSQLLEKFMKILECSTLQK